MVSPIKHRSTGPKGLLHLLGKLSAITACYLAFATIAPSRAADLFSIGDFDLRWDNTLRYSEGYRIAAADPTLLDVRNGNDGDRNFDKGLMSNRLDLLSAINLSNGDFGIEASLEAWYDTVYQERTATGAEFPRATRSLEGQYADLADTFAFGNFDVAGAPVTVKLGRQTLLWGESLFFDDNSIAAAQAPVDYERSIAAPNSYSSNVYLPVDQLSVSVQPTASLSLAAYYQFDWRGSRLPGVGSYFSTTDLLGAGAKFLFLGSGRFLVHTTDQKPNEGQLGVSLHDTIEGVDFGLYALRYDAKYPVLEIEPTAFVPRAPGYSGTFNSAYPEGIELYGAGFSTYLGDSNVAGEFAARLNAPLTGYPTASSYLAAVGTNTVLEDFASGNMLHAQVSSSTTLAPTSEWNSADLSVEVAANKALRVVQGAPVDEQPLERLESNIRVLFEPHYFAVLPGLDLSIPLGLGYDMSGQYGLAYSEQAGAGDIEAGVSATYMSVWKANLSLTRFIGGPDSQPLADRSFVTISAERTF